MKLKIVQPPRSRIELVPLIDSFFLILAFFIYSFLSMSVQKGIKLDLPSASTSETVKAENTAVSVDKDGRFFLDKNPVSREELRVRLRELFARAPEQFNLYILGDEAAPHGDVVYVLNLARELGIEKVLIETSPDAAQENHE